MTIAILLALGALSAVEPAEKSAIQDFEAGRNARDNGREARAAFAKAARGLDAAWDAGGPFPRSPRLALARARSHYLAGNLPRALLAVHDGLALAPFDAELQAELRALRDTIAYPDVADPPTRVRPDEPRGLRSRVSPWDAFLGAAVFGLLAAVGGMRLLTTRPRWAWAVAIVGLIGLAVCGGIGWRIETDEPRGRVIVAADAILRRGNGVSFPARLPTPLPKGAEVFEIARRGGWVQVELPGGATGWLPESHVLK